MTDEILRIAIPALAAILTAVLRRVLERIPKPLVPVIAAVGGAVGAAVAGVADTSTTAAVTGLASIGMREIVDQLAKARR